MNKNLSSNSYIRRINGYLDALSDIDGGQREFFASFGMIQSENITVESELKIVSPFMEDIKIINEMKYPKMYGITHFLEKLLLVKPFNGLYKTKVQISEEVIKEYRDYIIFHLEDYLDFAYEEEDIHSYKRNVQLLLVKSKNTRNDSVSCFITIIIEKENIKQFLNFYRKNYTEEEFLQYFNEIIAWEKQRKKESKEKFPSIK